MVCVYKHLYCSAQLSMSNMEKRYRNRTIIVIIIIIISGTDLLRYVIYVLPHSDRKPPRWPSGKASASRAEDPGFESRLRRDFFGVESYQ